MKLPKVYFHILLCVIFLLIPILSSPDLDRNFSMVKVPMFQREMLQMVLLIVFFYLNFTLLIPKLYNRKKHFLFALILLGCFLAVAILPQVLIQSSNPTGPNFGNRPSPENEFGLTIFRAFLPFCFAFLSSFFWYKSIEQQELERAKAKAELLNLKYQLQPHFLFNILNSVYSLTILKSDEAPEGILKLSSVMRYVVQESGQDLVELSKEIQYLKDYISLQLIRTDNSLDFSYTEIGEPKDLKISPLILVNFIENAFKYGFNAEENSKISISLMIEENVLNFKVFNRIVKHNVKDDSLGVGLKNTIERLQHLYPNDAHSIDVKNDGKNFDVNLKLKLSS